MQRILDGGFDAELTAWFEDARDAGVPLLVEFGTEVDGDWFPWNGRWNGGGGTTGYGDPELADGPERFRAYRHLVDLSRAAGADDLTWVFHVNGDSWPRTAWNRPAAYYPGDAYVDWIGVSIYGTGRRVSTTAASGASSTASTRGCVPSLRTSRWRCWSGGSRRGPDAAPRPDGSADALRVLRSGRWSRIKAASYWHEDWPEADGSVTDLRIDSSRGAARAYRRGVAPRFFVTRPIWLTQAHR